MLEKSHGQHDSSIFALGRVRSLELARVASSPSHHDPSFDGPLIFRVPSGEGLPFSLSLSPLITFQLRPSPLFNVTETLSRAVGGWQKLS